MKKYFYLAIILSVALGSCATDEQSPDKPKIIKKEKISGFVQKGPFVSGTSILMSELNSELVQTGKIFTSTIINDMGLFELKSVELNSSFVEFTSSGFYFNEVSGEISNSQITLTSLSDVSDKNSINVNILTHLEKRRVETLMKEGKSFSESKKQSRDELLSVFSMSLNKDSSFEEFDISKNTQEGGILLGISIILQGNRSVGQLTELLSRIQNDFGDNGKLDGENILYSLRIETSELDFSQIRENIQKRFKELNNNAIVPDFETQISNFLVLKSLNITIEGDGTVEERIITDPNGRQYPSKTVVELTPKPKEGWIFDGWSGDLTGNKVPERFTIDSDKNVTVKFKRNPNFYLHENGITCLCPNSKVGEKGIINGQLFESVDRDLLIKRLNEGKDLSKVCTSLITNMTNLFGSRPFNQPIGNWDVSNVTEMAFMFSNSTFNQPIGNWDVRKVRVMRGMFLGNRLFNQPIGNWNVLNVLDMGEMFKGYSSAPSQFNQPIENWDVRKMFVMDGMFEFSQFNQPIGKWKVSNVVNMERMFKNSPFNQNISKWCVTRITAEPVNFSTQSPLAIVNKPKWGTCPN